MNGLQRRAAAYLKAGGYFIGKGRNQSDRYSTAYLSTFNFKINTLLDIGVLDGSPVFYELFSDKRIAMVDPLPDLTQRAQPWIEKGLDVEIINAGAGREEGTMTLNISGPYSSFLQRTDGRGAPETTAVARVAPLDKLLKERGLKGPYGLKIDTEGFELEVIKGAPETLKDTAFVFAEVNLAKRFEGSYTPSQFIGELAKHGFELVDPIPNAKHSRHFDGLFMRTGG